MRSLLLLTIPLWYYTNAINGIAIQALVPRFEVDKLLPATVIVSGLTALQLVVGACLGTSINFCMISVFKQWESLERTSSSRSSADSIKKPDVFFFVLIALHGLGSLFTNLGFFYGKATIVQVIKLLEPFETLLISQALSSDELNISWGIIASMSVVVFNSIFLLKSETKVPHPYSITFALLSGVTLSLRNVLQRKDLKSKDTDASSNVSSTSKVQRSVNQFTTLSLRSGIGMSMFTILTYMISLAVAQSPTLPFRDLTYGVMMWHPMYNVFSMVTLGQCTALTHSLLNAGKRVFAIIMAIIWFKEIVTTHIAMNLFGVMGGGCWYVWEKKRPQRKERLPIIPSVTVS